jgi:hypothetical protein
MSVLVPGLRRQTRAGHFFDASSITRRIRFVMTVIWMTTTSQRSRPDEEENEDRVDEGVCA